MKNRQQIESEEIPYICGAFLLELSKVSKSEPRSAKEWRDWLLIKLNRESEQIADHKNSMMSQGLSPTSWSDFASALRFGSDIKRPFTVMIISIEDIEDCLEFFVEMKLARKISDEATPDYFDVKNIELDKLTQKTEFPSIVAEKITKYQSMGTKWLKQAVIHFINKRAEIDDEETEDEIEIPAADRIVTVDHNAPEHTELEQEIVKLKEEALRSTEGNKLSDNAEAALSDIDAGLLLWRKTTYRFEAIKNTLIAGIQSLASEIKKEGFKQVAKALTTKILSYLSGLG